MMMFPPLPYYYSAGDDNYDNHWLVTLSQSISCCNETKYIAHSYNFIIFYSISKSFYFVVYKTTAIFTMKLLHSTREKKLVGFGTPTLFSLVCSQFPLDGFGSSMMQNYITLLLLICHS